jgi:hypothetical protein
MATDLTMWARAVCGRAVWSASSLLVPALAVFHEQRVAQAIALYTLETVVAVALLRVRLGRALRGRPFDDPEAARLRQARQVAGMAAACSLVIGFLVLAFFVAYDVRPDDLFDLSTWHDAPFDGFGERVQWLAAGLLAGAVLDAWLAPVWSVEWLEASAAWQLRRVAAPAFAYLPGALLTAWQGSSAGFLLPWFLVRAFTDLTALAPGERERVRAHVMEAD